MSNIDFQNGLIVGLTANGVNIPMIVNKINTEAKWLEENPVLLNGEIIAVTFTSGTRLKVGDGVKTFSELEYLDTNILQAQSELQSDLQKKADLDSNGLVPTSQLPSYVDDVIDYLKLINSSVYLITSRIHNWTYDLICITEIICKSIDCRYMDEWFTKSKS